MNFILRAFLTFILLCIFTLSYSAVSTKINSPGDSISAAEKKWVDSVFSSLTPDQRLGQLFMTAAWSNLGGKERKRITKLISQYQIGGLIFMQGGPVAQAELTNYYQSISNTPLLISQDAEWGLGMRLDSTMNFPRQIALGAISDNELIYKMGLEIARQCRRIGVNIDFAPVVDVNTNPNNPVIGDRSFGDDKINVAIKGMAYMDGLQSGGIMACAKHFPGHGSTSGDSHLILPIVTGDSTALDSVEFFPFKYLFNNGVQSVMVAHLFVPALDTTKDQASTLSKPIVTDLLKNKLGFNGLIFTDALNMKGVSDYFDPGAEETRALLAGNDVLLYSAEIGRAIDSIKDAIAKNELSQDDIDSHVKKILEAKYRCGLSRWKSIDTKNIYEDLHTPYAQLLKQRLVENELTLVKNNNNFIPLQRLDTLKIVSIAIGADSLTTFQKMISQYAQVINYQVDKDFAAEDYLVLLNSIRNYNTIIVSIQDMNRNPMDFFGITQNEKLFIDTLLKQNKNVVLTLFGSPYALRFFSDAPHLLCAFSADDVNQNMAAQLLFGAIESKGHLPVTASSQLSEGIGIDSGTPLRLKYTLPEELGIYREDLQKVDSLVEDGIKQKAFPGCAVWAAKDGKVFYQKAFGNFTYNSKDSVKLNSLFDLASVTKIASSTLAVMKLYEQGKIKLDDPVSKYLPEFANTNKSDLHISEFMTHSAGLEAWIPFYKETLDNAGNPSSKYYSHTKNDTFSIEVTPDLFMRRDYIDSIWKEILNSPVKNRGHYLYSDLDMYIMQHIIEKVSGQTLPVFMATNFYNDLGLPTICFNPLQRFDTSQIVPTVVDKTFRHETVWGTVNDQGAAMLGGVSGHAGLFCDANDLGTLMEMLLDGGIYGAQEYLNPSTVNLFTSYQNTFSRRGLGFDKPERDGNENTGCIHDASQETFGHSGFTGTIVWSDPKNHFTYVFLSNRTYPDDDNWKIITMNIRTNIQQVFYDAMKKAGKSESQ